MARQDPGHGSPGADWDPQHPRHAEASATAMDQPPVGFFPAATSRATVTTGGLNQVRVSGVVWASTPDMSDSRNSQLTSLKKSYAGGDSNPLDNRAHSWTKLFDFPFLLRSALTPAFQTPSPTASLFSLRGRIIGLGVHWIWVEVPRLEVVLKDSAGAALIRWAQDLHIALTNSPGWVKHVPTGPLSSPTLAFLRHLCVAQLYLQLDLQAALGVHLSCKSTRLSLAAFQILAGAGSSSGLVITKSCLLGQLGAQRIDHEDHLSLLRGLASGLTSLTKHATGGVISSITGLAATFARNLHTLSLDSEYVQRVTQTRQRTGEPSSLFHGLRLGLSEFGISLLGGLTGIANHPLQALMSSVEEASSSSPSCLHWRLISRPTLLPPAGLQPRPRPQPL
ncbi:unnamed protein product [Schistocephalus solidus]|uniref:VPS13_C domain-containing protein n=1 Tax=Schistocephalus solidus TaxID=70667 RepID=A0A183TEG5_SCHSO|nr:unnamed protein product [Schistocephalus solidus]